MTTHAGEKRMSRGRPRGFEEGQALEAAMLLFWKKGFAKVNLTQLCREMGAPRQSVYHIFGDKRQLYIRCIHHYLETRLAPMLQQMAAQEDPILGIKEALQFFLNQSTENQAPGCFVANTLIDIGDSDPEISTLLQGALEQLEQGFYKALQRARKNGSLAQDKKPLKISRALTNTFLGMATLSKANPSTRMVRDVYDGALSMVS